MTKGSSTYAPPNSLKYSNANLKLKRTEEEGVRVCSLTCNILGVRRACWSSGMGTKMNDKQVNYSYEFAQIKQQVG
jgi:hypothetical protein